MPCKLPKEQQETRRAALPLSNSSNQEAVSEEKLACFMTTYPCKGSVPSLLDARLAYKDAWPKELWG